MEPCCCSSSEVDVGNHGTDSSKITRRWRQGFHTFSAAPRANNFGEMSMERWIKSQHKGGKQLTRQSVLLFTIFLLITILRSTYAYSKSFANTSEPIFIINFDMPAVICQNSVDSNDFRIHDMSALCDGKIDCMNGARLNDENFPYCENSCEAECAGRGACLRDGQRAKCFYNAAQREERDCGGQSCHWLARCGVNSLGTSECQCIDGYKGDGQICVDVDECAVGTARCSRHAMCINLPGSYICKCDAGFRSRGFSGNICEDVDECALGNYTCGPFEKCQNTEGGYVCVNECGHGYARSPTGDRCEDINECAASQATGILICDAHAQCVNTLGSFECRCEDGFTGDGRTCTPISDCTVHPNICDRRAECAAPLRTCVCRTGYIGDGALCEDVNECAQGQNACDNGKTCANIDGGFLCCDVGEDAHTCQQKHGTFCSGGCGRNAICYENACQCLAGYSGNPKINCYDVDECANSDICVGMSERCVNLSGGHICCGIDSEASECRTTSAFINDLPTNLNDEFSVDEKPVADTVVGGFSRNSVLGVNSARIEEESSNSTQSEGALAAAQLAVEQYKKGTQTRHEVREKKIHSGGYVLLTRRRNPNNFFDKQVDNFMEPLKCDMRESSSSCPINSFCVDGLCKCRGGFGWNVMTKICEDYTEVQTQLSATSDDRTSISSNEVGLEIGPHPSVTKTLNGLEIGPAVTPFNTQKSQSKVELNSGLNTGFAGVPGDAQTSKIDNRSELSGQGIQINHREKSRLLKTGVDDDEYPDKITNEEREKLSKVTPITESSLTTISENGLEISLNRLSGGKPIDIIDEDSNPENLNGENELIKAFTLTTTNGNTSQKLSTKSLATATKKIGPEVSGKSIETKPSQNMLINKTVTKEDTNVQKMAGFSSIKHPVVIKPGVSVIEWTGNIQGQTTADLGLEISGKNVQKTTISESKSTTEVGLEISGENAGGKQNSGSIESTITNTQKLTTRTSPENEEIVGGSETSTKSSTIGKIQPEVIAEETTEETLNSGLDEFQQKTTIMAGVSEKSADLNVTTNKLAEKLTTADKLPQLEANIITTANLPSIAESFNYTIISTTNSSTLPSLGEEQESQNILASTTPNMTILTNIWVSYPATLASTLFNERTIGSTTKSTTGIENSSISETIRTIPPVISEITEKFVTVIEATTNSISPVNTESSIGSTNLATSTLSQLTTNNENIKNTDRTESRVITASINQTTELLTSMQPSVVNTTESAKTTKSPDQINTLVTSNEILTNSTFGTVTQTPVISETNLLESTTLSSTLSVSIPLSLTHSPVSTLTPLEFTQIALSTLETTTNKIPTAQGQTISVFNNTAKIVKDQIYYTTSDTNMETIQTKISTPSTVEVTNAQLETEVTSTSGYTTSSTSLSTSSSISSAKNLTTTSVIELTTSGLKQTGCISSNNCGKDAYCERREGECRCMTGFHEQPGIGCIDVDECAEDTHTCHASAQCQNRIGGYVCSCSFGYKKNAAGMCEDIDECLEYGATALCSEMATCENVLGFYYCRCNVGYIGDGYRCIPLGKRSCTPEEWEASDCGRNHICQADTDGHIDCETCKRGFRLYNGVCADIDECSEVSESIFAHKCHADARCINLVGGYTCKCEPGYAGDGFNCVDIDECSAPMASAAQIRSLSGVDKVEINQTTISFPNGDFLGIRPTASFVQRCHPQAQCHNTPGAFNCHCPSNGILKCLSDNTNMLTGNATDCIPVNTVGEDLRAICECHVGYRYNSSNSACEDIDECIERRDVCDSDAGAVCQNLIGGYTCDCADGYEGVNGICKDIDECAHGVANCHSNAYCVNSPGEFSCHCTDEYSGNGIICSRVSQTNYTTPSIVDTDESVETSVGGCSDDWAASCRTLNKTCHVDEEEVAQCGSCLFGYQPMDGYCHQIDEVGNCADPSKNNCNANADCIDVHPGRHFCTCKIGFIGDGLRCDDVNECTILGLCDTNAICINMDGTFECTCKSGFQGNGFKCKEASPETTVVADAMIPTVSESVTRATVSSLKASVTNCSRNPTVCHPHAFCSRDDVCLCTKGFKGDGVYYCGKEIVADRDESSKNVNSDSEIIGKFPKKILLEARTPLSEVSAATKVYSQSTVAPSSSSQSISSPDTLSAPTVEYPRCGFGIDNVPSDGHDISSYVVIPSSAGAKCHELATCDFSRGDANGGICVCNPGYEGDGYTSCTPEWRDCRQDAFICHYNAKCDVKTGDCLCNEGFLGDGIKSCLPDSWDCEARGRNLCNTQAACINRRCVCRQGYVGDGINCMLAQLPLYLTANCLTCHGHALCNTTTRQCQCRDGYLGNGLLCVPDPLNCVHYPAICHPNARCNADSGKCHCNNGYNGDGQKCRRTTCLTETNFCHSDAYCLPSGNCRCKDGYFGDGRNCTSTVIGTATSALTSTGCNTSDAECVNGVHSCLQGYAKDRFGSCTDINECLIGASNCNKNAFCHNLHGSYKCVCRSGFVGDGLTCEQLPVQQIGDLGVQCHSEGIRVYITNTTQLKYGARLFVRGQIENPQCSKTFSTTPMNSDDSSDHFFEISISSCDVQIEENNTVAVTVILQKYTLFFTTESSAYKLRCTYPTSLQTVETHYNISHMSTESKAVEGTGPPPACTLAVSRAADDAITDAATVGEVLKLSLWVEPRQLYSVLPRNCYAINVASGERYALTDSSGCAIDIAIFPEWSHIHAYLAQALFRTFKWPDTSMIRFECDCSACFHICPTVNCSRRRESAAASRYRMKLRVARQNHVNFVEIDDNVGNDESDTWLSKFARNGAKAAFSHVVTVQPDNEETNVQRQIEEWLHGVSDSGVSLMAENAQKYEANTDIKLDELCVATSWLAFASVCLVLSVALFTFLCAYFVTITRANGSKCKPWLRLFRFGVIPTSNTSISSVASRSPSSIHSAAFDSVSVGDNLSSYIKFK